MAAPPTTDMSPVDPPSEGIWQARKIESLSLMAGRVAHDFNNLLMTILGNTDLALSTVGGMVPELRGYLEEIHAASDRAAELCRRLLAYSGKGRSVLSVVDVNELIRSMTEILEMSAGEDVRLARELAEPLPPTLANREELQQSFIEIARNSGESMGEVGGKITIATGMAPRGDTLLEGAQGAPLHRRRDYLYIDVRDDGPGMDARTRLNVFDPFFTTKGPGRGLGMARVFGMIRALSGRIHLESEEEVGTRLRIFLPVAEEPDRQADG